MERTDSIPLGLYTGYYWMSDAVDPTAIKTPDPCMADKINSYIDTPAENPFIIEGEFFEKAAGVSVSVKYVDGRYVVNRYDVKENIEDVKEGRYDQITLKHYVANRMPGLRLCFLQYWRERKDPLCCDMPVLQPAEKVFVGFEPLIENNEAVSTYLRK